MGCETYSNMCTNVFQKMNSSFAGITPNFIYIFTHIVGLGLHCLICFGGQISNNSNYRKKFEYLAKFILMKIRINLSKIEECSETNQNL